MPVECLACRNCASPLESDVACRARRDSEVGGAMAGDVRCGSAAGAGVVKFSTCGDVQLLPGSPAGMNCPSAGTGCQSGTSGGRLPSRSVLCHAGIGIGADG